MFRWKLTNIRKKLCEIAIFNVIDKNKDHEIAVLCPRGFQNRVMKAVLDADFLFGFGIDLQDRFDWFKKHFYYTGTVKARKVHKFGLIDYLPKQSNISEKGRLLGSYYHHAFKNTFSTCGKAHSQMMKVKLLSDPNCQWVRLQFCLWLRYGGQTKVCTCPQGNNRAGIPSYKGPRAQGFI